MPLAATAASALWSSGKLLRPEAAGLGQEVVRPIEAADDVIEVVVLLPRHGRIGHAGGVGFGASHPAFDPPQRGTEQRQPLPPIDALGDVGEPHLTARALSIPAPERLP